MPKVLKKEQKTTKHTESLETEVSKYVKEQTENILVNLLDAKLFNLAKKVATAKPELLNKTDGVFYPLECVIDNVEMFKYLHEKGATINDILTTSKIDITFLHQAIGVKNIPVVTYLLENCDPNLLNIMDSTLHHNALKRAKLFAHDDTSREIVRLIERYERYELYSEEDEDMLLIDINNENECRKVLKLMLRNDDKVNCYLKTNWINMSFTDQTKCWSIVKDYLNYWAHI
jgi:hypothetical protein